jgi:hypothetical protein
LSRAISRIASDSVTVTESLFRFSGERGKALTAERGRVISGERGQALAAERGRAISAARGQALTAERGLAMTGRGPRAADQQGQF